MGCRCRQCWAGWGRWRVLAAVIRCARGVADAGGHALVDRAMHKLQGCRCCSTTASARSARQLACTYMMSARGAAVVHCSHHGDVCCACGGVQREVDAVISSVAGLRVGGQSEPRRKQSFGSALFAQRKAGHAAAPGSDSSPDAESSVALDATGCRLSDIAELCCTLADCVTPENAPSLFDLSLKVRAQQWLRVCEGQRNRDAGDGAVAIGETRHHLQ